MSFTNDPLNPIDRIRITIGDIDEEYPLVEDHWYGWYLSQGYTENAVAMEIARKILALYVHSSSREVEGMVQVYGKEKFDSYVSWLKDVVANGLVSAPIPYAGGQSLSDMIENDQNMDNVRPFRRYNYEDFF